MYYVWHYAEHKYKHFSCRTDQEGSFVNHSTNDWFFSAHQTDAHQTEALTTGATDHSNATEVILVVGNNFPFTV